MNTVDRIIDAFPPEQQTQIRVQLSMVLRTVVFQQLLPDTGGGLVPAYEIMHVNTAVRNMIRDNKTYQIDNAIASGGTEGMVAMVSPSWRFTRRDGSSGKSHWNFPTIRSSCCGGWKSE